MVRLRVSAPRLSPARPCSSHAHSQDLDFGKRKHHVYIKSHLGFGLDAARNAALDLLTSRHEVCALPTRACLALALAYRECVTASEEA